MRLYATSRTHYTETLDTCGVASESLARSLFTLNRTESHPSVFCHSLNIFMGARVYCKYERYESPSHRFLQRHGLVAKKCDFSLFAKDQVIPFKGILDNF